MVSQYTNLHCSIKYGTNGSAMAPHGLIFGQDGAMTSRMVFIWFVHIFYAILGAFLANIGYRGKEK